jgi:hypothetical protein
LFAKYSIVAWGSSWDVALFLPFVATKSGKRQQGAIQREGRESPDSRRDGARSGNVQHAAAKDGERFFCANLRAR